MPGSDKKIVNRIKDRMLLGTIYDQLMLKLRYNDEKTHFLYSVMAGQKHRMIYYKRLKNRYLSKATSDCPWEKLPKTDNKDTVFVMWLQGIENAPEIVRKCIDSQKRALPDKKFVIIDSENYREYVRLPDYVISKWEKGIIGNAHFSDLIRNELLIKYGGFWIDATVFMTDNEIVSYAQRYPFFMFSFYYFGFNPEIMELNNWFIYSCSNNNMLCLLQKMLYMYWEDYDRAINYYIYQIFETIVNEFYEEEYRAIPILSQAQSHVLATYIYDDFDKEKYEFLKKTCGVHKLSTGFDKNKLCRKGSFYDVVINQGNY